MDGQVMHVVFLLKVQNVGPKKQTAEIGH
uniref:Uncharacterized protein n=1 Tax=Rhizophora mucronata TaxID=61149 RepID=A0A2P2PG27_RHIMU